MTQGAKQMKNNAITHLQQGRRGVHHLLHGPAVTSAHLDMLLPPWIINQTKY